MNIRESTSFTDTIAWLENRNEIVTCQHTPAKKAEYQEIPDHLHPKLQAALQKNKISKLYSHQATAVQLARQNKHFVVVTPTASGKTLCYNLPVLDTIIRDESARAIYLFPTKALSNDQMNELHETVTALEQNIKVHTFDGDTPQDARRAIRKVGQILISNPDMLHQGILPHHTKWAKLFTNLKYVVIDELHSYRGVFGSHLANVIRRLKRICDFYGSNPLFICASATIANPAELASQICGETVELVERSGAPSGEKYFFIYNPPVVNKELGIRASYLKRAKQLALKFLQSNKQTIVFTRSRLNVERLTKDLKESFTRLKRPTELVQGYRGGYLPSLRRSIETGLRNNKILGVISTNALELGIDIGGLDVAILAGYPGTVASTWQQAGRVGRKNNSSISVLVTSSAPLDQYIALHPDFFFSSPVESARISPDNLIILLSHLKCAAFELPFHEQDSYGDLSLEESKEILEYLCEHEVVHHSDDKYHWIADSYPANDISLRSVHEGNFAVVDITEGKEVVIGEVDFHSAPETIHEKAIYMVEGVQYQVKKLDWEGRKAYVDRALTDYYTDAMTYSRVTVLDVFDSAQAGKLLHEFGEVRINREVVGFKKIKFDTTENVGYDHIRLPEQEMHTTAYWFTIPNQVVRQLEKTNNEIIEGMYGISHSLHLLASVTLMCDSRDIGTCVGDKSAKWFAEQNKGIPARFKRGGLQSSFGDEFEPTLFIYDNYPGGIGFSQELFSKQNSLLMECYAHIRQCPCQEGCPACVGPVNESGDKAKTIAVQILSKLLTV